MGTKESLLFEKVMEQFAYSLMGNANIRLRDAVIDVFNSDKNIRYGDNVVVLNSEGSLDHIIDNFNNAFGIDLPVGDYDESDPLILVGTHGLRSIDDSEFIGLIEDEPNQKYLSDNVLMKLSETDITDTFLKFIEENYPEIYDEFGDESVYGYNVRDLIQYDWDELAREISRGAVNEGRTFRVTEQELKTIVSEGTKEVYYRLKEGKSGIHIDPENKGKFTATKKRTGKSTEELTHSKNPLTRKRAQFALNAKKWNHSK